MKELVLGAMHELESDLKELARLRFEANEEDEHTFNALALRVHSLSELVDKYFTLADESAKNAVRWKLAFQTPGVSIRFADVHWNLVKDTVEDGKVVGKKLLAAGETIPKAVDKFLGF